MIQFIRLDSPVLMPTKVHYWDAGIDLRSSENAEIAPGETKLIDTGVAVKITAGYFGLVVPRSSQGKIGISLANTVGIIDSDYRGNIKLMIKNNGTEVYKITRADTRIGQLITLAHSSSIQPLIFCGTDSEWNDTARGTGGFGSTG